MTSRRARRNADFTIIDMIKDPRFLGDKTISVPQIAILKAIYGLGLTSEELSAFETMTEGRKPRRGGYTEATLICGIRSGKTDKIAANIALYESLTFDPSAHLAPGEVAYFPVIAQSTDGARTAWNYIEGKVRLL